MINRGEGDQSSGEAADWLARLNTRAVSHEELEEFYAWRRQPGNAEAYAKVEALWREARSLGGDRDIADAVREALERPRQRAAFLPTRRRQVLAGAGALVLVAAGATFFLTRAQIYATGIGEQRLVTLADGSRLRINTNSRLAVDYSSSARDVELLQGQAFFEVKSDPERPFTVSADGVEVRTLGTRFDVRRAGAVQVVLVDGSVAVSAGDEGVPSLLSPGEAVRVGPDGRKVEEKVDLEAATSWTSGRMVFRETPLGQAIAEANRYSARQIELRSPALRNLRVDGTFETGDVDAFVAALTTLFPVHAEKGENGSIILTAT
ncbi:FecR family protein [Allosphingosinicella vermicomposti]|uniref:FecR family protein n=1 Tax=Allosphingosinicella vermicomposti TaxID=614671 RepID=UPI000D0F2D93|nr:FecR family protein [Allosphingosinicella vermicomposti]